MSSTYCKDPAHGWFDPECPYCRIEELEASTIHAKYVSAMGLIKACEPYLKDGETPAECIQRNRDDSGAVLKLLAKEKRKYEALVEGITFAQSHTSETLHLLQWDQLGWDVPEEVIESLVKADSKLRALLESDS